MIAAALLVAAMSHDAAPAQTEPAKPPLFDDLGSYHRAVTTKVPEAQRYFDQGLRLLYGFNHDESERAFREAARLDSGCAICWWGVALTLGPNINLPIDPERNGRAVDAVAKAEAVRGKASPVERALIDAVAKRYAADPNADRAKLDQAYADAMRGVCKRFPKDDDVATLYAEAVMDLRPWKFWSPDGKPAPGTLEIVSTLESVLKRSPNHPGANHYYIHATEASQDARRALPSAKRLETLVPGAGHLVHMPAHVYMRTGNYAGASEANAKAAVVDEAYIKAHDVQGVYPMMYYTHNLQFLAASAAMEGRAAVSLDAAKRTTDIATPMFKDMAMVEFVVPFDMYYKIRFEKWDDVLAIPEPDPAMTTYTALRRFGRGAALAARGKVDEALAEKKAFDEAAAKVPADTMMNLNTSKDLLAVARESLDARIAAARGDSGAAIAAWRRAVAAEDALAYDEPPAWYHPTRESLGGSLLRAGKASEAEAVFREDLERHPNNGRSLFGLAESLKAQKKTDEAAKVEALFRSAWSRADIPLDLAGL